MLQKKPPAIYIFLAFVILTMVAYWQVAFLQNSLKWDMIDCYLPWRYHVGECLQNGIFPFWNPYTHCGYPIHADLRSVWYPETFLVGLTTGYSNLTLHLLFILHLSLAGLGMYLLSRHFTSDWRAGAIAGAAYILSGFFVGHGQEMFGIIAATWIPFVLYYFIRLQLDRKPTDIIPASLFAFLLVTGGYQAMWAILLYLLLAIFIVYFIKYLREQNLKEALRLLKLNLLLGFVTGLSLMVIVVTLIQVSPHLGRLGGVSLEDAWFMPFSPRSAISFLLPFASVKDAAFYDTDISMNNAYAGMIVLVFFILSLFSKRKVLMNLFLVFGLVSLLASFGKYTPVRGILYHLFPLMDLFRHSSFFSYFTVLAIILGASAGLGDFFASPFLFRKKIIWISGAIGSVIIVLLASSLIKMNQADFLFFKPSTDFAAWLAAPDRYEHIIFHAILQLVFLTVFLLLIRKLSSSRKLLIAAIILVEMAVSVQLNIYYTVASPGVSPKEIVSNLDRRAPGFPLPQRKIPVILNTEQNASYSVLWRNTNIFNKTVSFEGFNSFRLKGCEVLADSFPQLARFATNNAPIYLSDKLLSHYPSDLSIISSDNTALFVDENSFPDGSPELSETSSDSLQITEFSPGNVMINVGCKNSVAVTLLQAWYPGWKVFVDGVETKHFVSNKMFISTICSPGKHIIEFTYSNPWLMAGFGFSCFVIISLISILVYNSLAKRTKVVRISVLVLGWFLLTLLVLNRFNPFISYGQQRIDQYNEIADRLVKSGVSVAVFNTDDAVQMMASLKEAGYKGTFCFQNLTYQSGHSDQISCLDSLKTGRIARVNLFAPVPAEADAAFYSKWSVELEKHHLKSGSMSILSMGADPAGFESINGFEESVSGWNGNPDALDSLIVAEGNYSNRVDSLNQGSYAFKWTPDEHQYNRPFEVFIKAQVSGDFSGSSMFMQQRRGTSIVRSYSAGSGTYGVAPGKWSNITKVGNFPEGLKKGDELTAFFWGNGRNVFYVDNFSIAIRFPSD